MPFRSFVRCLTRHLLVPVLASLLCLAAPAATAASASFSIGFDADANSGTGCTLSVGAHSMSGVEVALDVTVTTSGNAGTVGAIARRTCVAGAFGPPVAVSAGGWAVGMGAGMSGSDLVETFLPLAALAGAEGVRIGVVTAGDSLVATSLLIVQEAPPAAPATPIPALSPLALAGLLLLVAGTGWLMRRYTVQGGRVLLILVVVSATLTTYSALAVVYDGNGADWSGVVPLATDPKGDAPAGEDLVALYAVKDGGNVALRVDLVLARDGTNQAPTVGAGGAQSVAIVAATGTATANLSGSASDDGLPNPPGALTTTWSAFSGPAAVTFGNASALATTATFPAAGVYTLRLTASDSALQAHGDVQITVTDSAPVLRAVPDRTITLGTRYQQLLTAQDAIAGDTLTYSLPTAPSGAALAPSPLVDWMPTAAQVGQHTFTAKVVDAAGHSATTSFKVTVVHTNHAPQLAVQPNVILPVGTAFARLLQASDPDVGDTQSFTLVSGPNGMTLAGADLAWNTAGRTAGDYTVTVRVTDSASAFDQKSFIVTLQTAAAPVAIDDSYTVAPGATLTVAAPGVLGNDIDASGGGMTATKLTDPTKGTLSAFNADGSFTFVAPGSVPASPSLKANTLWGALIPDNTGYGQAADINHDGGADVIVHSYGTPYAFDGKTGATLWSSWDRSATSLGKNCETYLVATDFALGDVDGSGNILYVAGANCDAHAAGPATRLIGVDTDPAHAVGGAAAVKWVSERLDVQVPLPPGVGAPPVPTYLLNPVGDGLASYATPTLAKLVPGGRTKVLTRYLIGTGMFPYDSDGDGTRESFASCYAATGNIADNGKACGVTFILDAATGAKEAVLTAPNPYSQYESAERTPFRQLPPVVADLDGDGQVEIISGTDVFKYDGTHWSLAWQAGLPGVTIFYEPMSVSVADLDGDGKAEVVLHAAWYDGSGYHRGFLTYRHDGVLLHRFEVPFWDTGTASIADVDGDGIAEILIVGRGVVWAYKPDGTLVWASAIPDDVLALHPDDDPALIHWPKATGDRSSGGNGLQVYDLDLDGHPEVIVTGVHRLSIYDGRTGRIKSSMHNNAVVRTNIVPLVVDANGDGHADILSPAGNPGICGGCPSSNILAFSGVDRNWAPAPLVQNQMSFNPWAVDNTARILYDGGVHRSFRTQRQLGTVVDPRTRDTATFTYAAVGGGGTSAPATVSLQIVPQNSPPIITSTPPTALYAVPNSGGQYPTFVYQIAAIDPDVGDTVHYELVYSTINLAYFQQATVDPVTGVLRMFTGPCGGGGCDFGLMTFIVAAVDSTGARTEQGFVVDVTTQPRTVPAVVGQGVADARNAVAAVQLMAAVNEVFSAQPVGTVVAQDPAAGTVVARSSTVTMSVSKGPQPVTMPFVVGKQIAGVYTTLADLGLSVNVTTAFSTTIPAGEVMTQTPAFGTVLIPATAPPVALTVSAGGPLPAAVVSMRLEPGPGPLARRVGENVAFKAIALLADGTSADVSLTAAWSSSNSVAASVDVTGFVKAKAGGSTTIAAVLSGKTGQVVVNVAAVLSGDPTPPTATITAPSNGANVTGPVAVTGTATDANFLRYELAFSAAGTDVWTSLAEGSSPVTNGTLGNFDPTLLLNDLYTLRLRVFDRSHHMTETTSTVQVSGNRKLGAFSLTFTDLAIPMSGLPISIERTYDSRDKAKGDFGIGWRIGVQTLRLRTNRVPGTGWVRNVSGINVSLAATDEHKVSVTLQDGRVEEFDMMVSPTSNIGSLDATSVTGYVARAGTLGTLQALGNKDLLIVSGGSEDELVDDSTLDTYDPALYRYTSPDGVQYEIHKSEGVKKLIDRNGNTLTFNANGIVHSAGKSVTFTRDTQGRIAQIADPLGNVLNYTYDGNGDLVAYADASSRVSRYAYDWRHNLIDMQDPAGNHPARNEYDDAGRIVATTDAAGNRIEYTHDLGSSQEIVRDRLGNPTLYTYDVNGNIVAKTDALGGHYTYTYDARNNRLTSTDPLGRVAVRSFDSSNNMLTSSDFDGNTTTRTYNARRQVTSVVDPEGRTTTNVYDANGNLTQETAPEGGVTHHSYNGAGNRLTTTDPLGNVSTFTYDAYGNQPLIADALGNAIPLTYDANGRLVNGADAAGHAMQFGYDAVGRLTLTIDKLGHASATSYSDVGSGRKIASYTDAVGKKVLRTFDVRGNEIGSTFPDGSSEAATFDAEGHVLTRTNRDGRTTSYQYDALGRLTRTTNPDGTTIVRTYDAVGRVLTMTNERGKVTTYAYAANKRTTTDALGNVRVEEYDSRLRVVKATDALGRITRYTYDSNSNIVRTDYPDGTYAATTYDTANRKIAETDQAGRTLQFAYDAADRLIKVTDAAGGITQYAYDAVGNRIAETDAKGRVTQLQYDAAGHVVKRTRPLGQFESFIHDASGNRLLRTDFNGQSIAYAYDAANRLAAKTLPGGTVVSYAYTGSGLRTQAGGDSYQYDLRGRLVRETKASGDVITYTYDAAGNRATMATPQGTTTYNYDALDRLATLTDANGTTSYTYDAVGNLAGAALPNGTSTAYTYDSLNRLTQLVNSGPGGVISSYTYTLGPAGNRLKVVEAGPATTGRSVSYTYDAVYRLTQEAIDEPGSANDQTIAYAYDAVGNRTQTNRAGVVTNYTYDANDRLTAESSPAGTTTSTYDANGNLNTRSDGGATDTYSYDAEDRLVGVSMQSGPAPAVLSFTYDADGMRTARTVAGVSTTFLLDKNGELAQTVAETTSAVTTTYTRGHGLISQTRPGNGTRYYLADGQLSVRQLTTAAGAVSDGYTYDAFGGTLATTGTTTNAYRYVGEPLDPNVGFYYLRARYYAPAQGRFISTDPELGNVFEPVTLHRYLYARNDPITRHDPSGREDLISLLAAMAIQNTLRISLYTGLAAGATTFVYTGDPIQAGADATFATLKAVGSLGLLRFLAAPFLAAEAEAAKAAGTAAGAVADEAGEIGARALERVAGVLKQTGGNVVNQTVQGRIVTGLVQMMEQSATNKFALCAALRVVGAGSLFLGGSGIYGLFTPQAYLAGKLVFQDAIFAFCGAP